MAKTKCNKDEPFQYIGSDGVAIPYKVGDIVEYYIGKRLGNSHGEILTIATANISVNDFGHYKSQGKPNKYIRREYVRGIHIAQNNEPSNVLEFISPAANDTEISKDAAAM